MFSIVDPANPVEIAYDNAPSDPDTPTAGSYAMASPSFVPERNEIWYSDGHSGFHVVRLAEGIWPPRGATPVQAPSAEPATGGGAPRTLALAAMLSGVAALWLALRGRRTIPSRGAP